MSGPLRRVLDAIAGGAGSLSEIEQVTGLGRDVVGASVDHLVRLGRLEVRRVGFGCAGSCADCADGARPDALTCDVTGPGLTAFALPKDGTP